MMSAPRRRGFTLTEMLVVIGIIVVLMAILLPVLAIARTKAKETQCRANLHQLAMALKQYRTDHGRFPGLPYYDGAAGRYKGGFSDLYPDYIDSTKLLICPMDATARRLGSQARDRVYCSYNGEIDSGGNFTKIHYNYNGYDGAALTGNNLNQPCESTGVDNLDGTNEAAYIKALLSEYTPLGRNLGDAPRLKNRAAPGTTIITHCVNHRGNKPTDPGAKDFVARLDGDVDVMQLGNFADPDGTGLKVSTWISQLK